jgi:hypothetical protein
MSKKKRKLVNDPRRPQLFSNEELGLPEADYEYKEVVTTDSQGRKVRQRIVVKSLDGFIRAAREVWGNQNDYSESVLTGMKEPITIRCRKHDHYYTVPFAQNHITKPGGRLKPTGCPLCASEKAGYETYRGPHHFRTPEERERDEQEKARRLSEREQQKQERKSIAEQVRRERQQRERDEQALIARWHAASLAEARFIERVHEKYPDLDTALVDYGGPDKEVALICPLHGLFEIKPRTLLNGSKGHPPHGCWQCAGLPDPHTKCRLTAREFYRRTDARYGKKIIFERKRKIKPTTNITGTCYRHGAITHDAAWWLSGKGCEYCNGKVYYPHWKDYARQVHGDKYEYVGDAPTMSTDLIHYICPEHGLIEQRFDVHVSQGCGCPKCANYPNKKSPEQRCQEWIEKSEEKYRGEFDYSEAPADYVNNDSKVWLTHKPCGTRFQITPDTHLRGVNGGCPVCNAIFLESEGERTVRLWLEDHHIDHDTHHKLPNEDPTLPLLYLKTDFWIDDFDGQPLVIEYNGEPHYEDIGYFYHGRVRNFEVQQHRDRYLRQYCRAQGYRLLEIPYWEFDHIDSILTTVLLNHEPIPTFEPPSTPGTQQAPTEA